MVTAAKIFTPDQPQQIVSELTYICYKFNRQESPATTPEQWAKIFGSSTEAMEERYKLESEVR